MRAQLYDFACAYRVHVFVVSESIVIKSLCFVHSCLERSNASVIAYGRQRGGDD